MGWFGGQARTGCPGGPQGGLVTAGKSCVLQNASSLMFIRPLQTFTQPKKHPHDSHDSVSSHYDKGRGVSAAHNDELPCRSCHQPQPRLILRLQSPPGSTRLTLHTQQNTGRYQRQCEVPPNKTHAPTVMASDKPKGAACLSARPLVSSRPSAANTCQHGCNCHDTPGHSRLRGRPGSDCTVAGPPTLCRLMRLFRQGLATSMHVCRHSKQQHRCEAATLAEHASAAARPLAGEPTQAASVPVAPGSLSVQVAN